MSNPGSPSSSPDVVLDEEELEVLVDSDVPGDSVKSVMCVEHKKECRPPSDNTATDRWSTTKTVATAVASATGGAISAFGKVTMVTSAASVANAVAVAAPFTGPAGIAITVGTAAISAKSAYHTHNTLKDWKEFGTDARSTHKNALIGHE